MIENKRFTFDIDNENGYNEEPYFCNGIDSFYVNNADEMELFIKEINKLAEEKEDLESFKKLVYLVLKKEYDLRMNEMNIFAEKEDWQGYRATQLERGTVQRIAKRLGVDLE